MKTYTVEINGIEHTFQYSDEDAKARGLKSSNAVDAKAAATPANKSRTAKNKSA